MNTLGLTYDDLRTAALFLTRYAAAVESKLYMNMKVDAAFEEIDEANRLAELLKEAADRIDTDIPEDSG